GGMKRKLEIIRSLMHNPQILFLDEPTQGLDASSRSSLWQYLQRVREQENITIFLTTHYLEEAEGADRVCMINHGKIAMLGTPEEIKNRLLDNNYMHLDAENRAQLKAELQAIGADFTETKRHLKVFYEGKTPQALLARLKTPLTRLEVHQPTLEEAYVDLIENKERREAI
ncbi:MAG TPA: ABC transporter ATP-binding protein, partial [Bacillales bacterium]|nr:ABC transporter ATP-binding protein [Bacillales bacterium]